MSVKLISAAIVLLVGFALASLFPNRAHVVENDPAAAGVSLRRTASEPRQTLAGAAPRRDPLPPLEAVAMPDPETPANRLAARPADGDRFRSPPPMPSNFAAAGEDVSRLAAVDSPSARSAEPRTSSQPPRATFHRVVDGDTLGGLAARYLGDAALADRIRQANLDRLPANPNWLPIGVELQIPAGTADAPGQGSTIARHDTAETRLVPVESAPVVADTQPR